MKPFRPAGTRRRPAAVADRRLRRRRDPEFPSGPPSGAPVDPRHLHRVVSFGDSLSDVGTYTPATLATGDGQPPFFGGKFTTNAAASHGLGREPRRLARPRESRRPRSASTARRSYARRRADPASRLCSTGYGQGGARVTDPNGIGHNAGGSRRPHRAGQDADRQPPGALRRLQRQRPGLRRRRPQRRAVQFGAFGPRPARSASRPRPGRSPPQAQAALLEAQAQAEAAVRQAAHELTGYLRNEILATARATWR